MPSNCQFYVPVHGYHTYSYFSHINCLGLHGDPYGSVRTFISSSERIRKCFSSDYTTNLKLEKSYFTAISYVQKTHNNSVMEVFTYLFAFYVLSSIFVGNCHFQ